MRYDLYFVLRQFISHLKESMATAARRHRSRQVEPETAPRVSQAQHTLWLDRTVHEKVDHGTVRPWVPKARIGVSKTSFGGIGAMLSPALDDWDRTC
jgi:hypothetical protein